MFSDSRATRGDLCITSKKIYKHEDFYYATVGSSSTCDIIVNELKRWHETNKDLLSFTSPEFYEGYKKKISRIKSQDDNASILLLSKDLVLLFAVGYSSDYPEIIADDQLFLGSGDQITLGAYLALPNIKGIQNRFSAALSIAARANITIDNKVQAIKVKK